MSPLGLDDGGGRKGGYTGRRGDLRRGAGYNRGDYTEPDGGKDIHKDPQLYLHQHQPSRGGDINLRGMASLAKIFLMSVMACEEQWNKLVVGVLRLRCVN
jgi:hypothetical protein